MTATAATDQLAVFADPDWRSDLWLLIGSTKAAARGYAADCFLIASLAERVPAPVGSGEGAVAWQSFLREIAVARGIQERAAGRLVEVAVLLARHLPRTVERLSSGSVTVERARMLADELVGVDPAVALEVDRLLCDRIPDMAPERIRRAVRREVDRLDADAAADRAAKAAAERGVRLSPERDGQACAALRGPAVPMTRWFLALTEAARAQQAAGDPRGLDALRFDLVMAGFTSPDDRPARRPEPAALPAAPAPEAEVPEALLSREEIAERCSAEATPDAPAVDVDVEGGPAETDAAPTATRSGDAAAAPDAGAPPGATRQPDPTSPPDSATQAEPARQPDAAAPVDRTNQPDPASPPDTAPPVDEQVLEAARAEAVRMLHRARQQAERVLDAAHAAEADALDRLAAARAEADRLTAQALRERLARSTDTPDDRRHSRPVQLLVHVPVTTLLGLADEPGWLDGYGWLNAPQCRQLLPVAELRQVCVSDTGQLVDLAPRAVRPAPTPAGAREALLRMATEPSAVSDTAWQETDAHDPPRALAEFVRLRDRFCDGPLGTLVPAAGSDLDHDQPHPGGPTAAWNLRARARRTHRLKHRGWLPVATRGGTEWTSPAGQLTASPHVRHPVAAPGPDARLADPDELHALETEILQPPDEDRPSP